MVEDVVDDQDLAAHAEPFTSEGRPGPDGRTIGVLLSHGFTGSPASMKPWGQFLAEQGYAVSVPRLPGHGGSSWKDLVPTRYDDWFDTVQREYDVLRKRCDAVVVAGLSMGGCLALDLATRRPDVAGLVLVNPAVASTNKQLRAVPVVKHLIPAAPAIGNDIKKPGVVEHGYDKTPLKPLASLIVAWKRIREELPKVTCPVLLFRSAEDHVVDPSSARLILGTISSRDVREVVLENSYHVATLDNDAKRIFTESEEFVRRVTAG